VFLSIELNEKVVQVNTKQLTRVEYEADRIVFHFSAGGSWELQGPTAKQVAKVKKVLGGAAVTKKGRRKAGRKARAAAGLFNGAT
jgi:hypothetical protein